MRINEDFTVLCCKIFHKLYEVAGAVSEENGILGAKTLPFSCNAYSQTYGKHLLWRQSNYLSKR